MKSTKMPKKACKLIVWNYTNESRANTQNKQSKIIINIQLRHCCKSPSAHLPHVCQWTGRPGSNAEFHPPSGRQAGHWWWSASRCLCRRSQTDPWETNRVFTIRHQESPANTKGSMITNYSVSSRRHQGSIGPVCDAVILFQHAVVFTDALGQICHEGDLHFTQTSLLSGGVGPAN